MGFDTKTLEQLEQLAENLRQQIRVNPQHTKLERTELRNVEEWIEIRRKEAQETQLHSRAGRTRRLPTLKTQIVAAPTNLYSIAEEHTATRWTTGLRAEAEIKGRQRRSEVVSGNRAALKAVPPRQRSEIAESANRARWVKTKKSRQPQD